MLYNIITAIFTLLTLVGVYFELSMHPDAVTLLVSLGYPVYFNYILGVAKFLGLIGIWQRRISFLIEWAYAGFVIDFLAAIVSHVFVEGVSTSSIPAFVNLLLISISYYLYRKNLK